MALRLGRGGDVYKEWKGVVKREGVVVEGHNDNEYKLGEVLFVVK